MSFAADYKSEGAPGTRTARGVFVPPWYKPHEDLSVEVKSHDGSRGFGFTIGDVAVERRWAIAPDGRVMEGHEFTDRLTEWYIGQWAWNNPPQPPLPVDTSGYPTPENYVGKGPNPSNPRQLVHLHKPSRREPVQANERPVYPQQMARTPGWQAAPKKDK